jgi:hypothetical protein
VPARGRRWEELMIPDLERGLDELQRKLEQLKVYL